MESLLFVLNGVGVALLVFMGLRDDRRPKGTPQTSLFRYSDMPNRRAPSSKSTFRPGPGR